MNQSNSVQWAGEWPEDILLDFVRLTSEQAIEKCGLGGGSVLAPAALSIEATSDNQAQLLAKAKEHEAYRRLAQLPELKQIESERKRRVTTIPSLGGPAGELRMLRTLALLVGSFNANFRPRRADLAHKRKVHATAARLVELLIPGAQPYDIFEASTLRNGLQKLVGDLDLDLRAAKLFKRRSSRDDAEAPQRYWLESFARLLVQAVGDAPVPIVRSAAAMVGYFIDDRTTQRYIKAAKDRIKREALAAALRSRAGDK